VKPRTDQEKEAEASFKLAVYSTRSRTRSWREALRRAQELNPDDWNYHRQEWSFTPTEAGKKWLEKFQKLEQPYYPKLEIPTPPPKQQ